MGKRKRAVKGANGPSEASTVIDGASKVAACAEARTSRLDEVRRLMHVSHVPDDLPGREEEFQLIYEHLSSALEKGDDISGVPGTGKTATVRQVVKLLQQTVEDEALPPFHYHEINCMKLAEPDQAYTAFWSKVNPKSPRVSPNHASDLLQQYFKSSKKSRRTPIILLLDELDQLVTRTQSVIYNFFDWPRVKGSALIVIAVANTMDLPERMFSQKINSRVGSKRVAFKAYDTKQLIAIIESRTKGSMLINHDAIEFCAKKVAGMSGDARRALDIIRRSVEHLQALQDDSRDGEDSIITRTIVMKVSDQLFKSSTVCAIQHCSFLEKIILVSLWKLGRNTGQTDFSSDQTYSEYRGLCARLQINAENSCDVASACYQLFSMRLIVMEGGKATDPRQRIRLLVSDNDVYLTLKRENDRFFL